MTQQQEGAQRAFEEYSQAVLQSVVNMVGDNPDVQTIWLYSDTTFESVTTYVFVTYRGQFMEINELEDHDSAGQYDVTTLYGEILAAPYRELAQALKALPEAPERIVTEYDPHAGRLQASWDYDVIAAGDAPFVARDRWIEEHGGRP